MSIKLFQWFTGNSQFLPSPSSVPKSKGVKSKRDSACSVDMILIRQSKFKGTSFVGPVYFGTFNACQRLKSRL